ncbi:hypothetical protein ACEQPO_16720 [Bacillus sp. SL00103]
MSKRTPIRKNLKKIVRVETRSYQNQLHEEINIDREEHGKKPLPLQNKKKQKKSRSRTTDPESIIM